MTIAELIKWVFRFGVCSLFVHRLVRQSNENGIGGIRNEMQTFGGLSTKNEKNYLTICTPERENEVYRIQLTVCTIGCVCVCANRWIHSLHLDHWFIDCRPAARSIPNYWNWWNGTIWLMNAAHILAASLKPPFSTLSQTVSWHIIQWAWTFSIIFFLNNNWDVWFYFVCELNITSPFRCRRRRCRWFLCFEMCVPFAI